MTSRSSHRKRRPRVRRRVSVIGVIGEILVTAGVFVLLFLGWQLGLQDILVGGQQQEQAQALTHKWELDAPKHPTKAAADPGVPVVMAAPANATPFATLYVPRWGASWTRTIAQGVGVADVLDKIGVGHYPGTQMPGAVGNFAIAAHRHAYGGGFEYLHQLHVGDHVYVGTAAGWYEYTFRDIQYVQPNQVNVLQPVPMEPGATPTDRILTMTTCNPFFSTRERMIGYAVFDTWYPIASGPPTEIAAAVPAASN